MGGTAGALYYKYANWPEGALFPYTGGVVTVCGAYIGTVRGTMPVLLGHAGRVAFTVAGVLAGALLFERLIAWLRSSIETSPLLLLALFQVPLLLIAPTMYDRYVLSVLPGALWVAGVNVAATPAWRSAGLAILAASVAISIGLVHDCLAWNRVRWDLGRQALAQSKSPWDIEGGFEWNGWYSCEAPKTLPKPTSGGLTMGYARLQFPHVTGRYALAFSIVPGSVSRTSLPYTLWLVPGTREFYFVEEQR
jgi:hypothetical protein